MIRIRVEATRGSTPRETGAQMHVGALDQTGTIGGGALEWEAMRIGREMLAAGQIHQRRTIPLGPGLGQCCGGAVTLSFERVESVSRDPGRPLWIFGAGHTGRAIAAVVAPLPGWDVTLVDISQDRMPPAVDGVELVVAADPARLVTHMPVASRMIILTHSHDLDLKLCDAALRQGVGDIGLIGSATKWARFRSRLGAAGHDGDSISRIACPIGDPSLGKHPQAIAVGVAAALLCPHEERSDRHP